MTMSVNNCWSCIVGNLGGERFQTIGNELLTAFIGKEDATCSLPHLDNECQRSINDWFPCIMAHYSAIWPLLSRYIMMNVFVH